MFDMDSDQDHARLAVASFVGAVEQVANGTGTGAMWWQGRMCDDLDLVLMELLECLPVTAVVLALADLGE